MTLLKRTKLKVKALSDLLNETEENIVEFKDNIRKKKGEYTNVKNHIEYWEKKCNDARTSLASAIKAPDNYDKVIQELKNEFETLKELLEKTASSENDIVELRNSQVNRYMILKTEVENQAKDFINRINDLMQTYQYKLDNENRVKEELENKYDRLANLCKPIHSRYNVAVTKVFGENMDAIVVDTEHTAKQCIDFLKQHKIGVERFLSLDLIKVKPINDRLRSVLKQINSKLLYAVLKLSFMEIDKAVLYVTKNTLVCETAEDARKMAFENITFLKFSKTLA
ncbi:structural maintenance of chromosomes protein 1B [Polyergus mexicanus]|uniref:structural maintenance of chromosomes protein 1B n=1 Tax=Polyergus mexicanus TaxID=615972 RepID=UPI0038B4E8F0